MAAKKPNVSKKGKSANTKFSTLIHLPQSIREGSELRLQQKVLLNYYLGLRETWGNPFYKSNDEVVKESGVPKSTFKPARDVLVEKNYLTFNATGIRGEATVYNLNPDKLAEWDEEKLSEKMNLSHIEFRGRTKGSDKCDNTMKTNDKKGSDKCDNTMKTNDKKGSDKGVGQRGREITPETDSNTDSNDKDDNDMTKNEMLIKILSRLDEIEAKIDSISERMDKESNELTEICQAVGQVIALGSGNTHLGVGKSVGQKVETDPHITYTSLHPTKTSNNKPTNTESKGETTRVHAQEGLVGCGEVEQRGADTTQPSPEEQAKAQARYNAISFEIEKVVGSWNQTHDTQTAQASLKPLCTELHKIKHLLPSEAWNAMRGRLKSIQTMLAPQQPQPTAPQAQPTPQQNNPTASECFGQMDAIIEKWKIDHNSPIADVAIGKIYQTMRSINASARQMGIVNGKAEKFYKDFRGMDGIPHISYMLGAMTPAQTTPPLSELILTNNDAKAITSPAEWVKARKNAPEDACGKVSEEEVGRFNNELANMVVMAEGLLRNFPNESVRILEATKAKLRPVLAEQHKWSDFGNINIEIIAPIIAIETMRSGDAGVLAGLYDMAYNSDTKYFLNDVIYIVRTVLSKYGNALSNDLRGEISGMCLRLENKVTDIERKDKQPIPVSVDDKEDEELPF